MFDELRNFWDQPTVEQSRARILPPELDWEAYTRRVVPFILTPVVMTDLLKTKPRAALEIGCGLGRLMVAINQHFDRITGIDISPKMVDHSRGYLAGFEHLLALICDGVSFPAASDSMAFVYSVLVFQHIPYRDMIQRYLAESCRVLRPSGLIRVQTHAGEPCEGFHGARGCHYPTLAAFAAEFTAAGFEILESSCRHDYLWVTAKKPHPVQ